MLDNFAMQQNYNRRVNASLNFFSLMNLFFVSGNTCSQHSECCASPHVLGSWSTWVMTVASFKRFSGWCFLHHLGKWFCTRVSQFLDLLSSSDLISDLPYSGSFPTLSLPKTETLHNLFPEEFITAMNHWQLHIFQISLTFFQLGVLFQGKCLCLTFVCWRCVCDWVGWGWQIPCLFVQKSVVCKRPHSDLIGSTAQCTLGVGEKVEWIYILNLADTVS